MGRGERLNKHPLFWIFKVEFVVSGADGDKGDSGLMEPGDPPMRRLQCAVTRRVTFLSKADQKTSPILKIMAKLT